MDRITTMVAKIKRIMLVAKIKGGKGFYTWPEIESYFQSFPRINEYSDGTSIL